MDSSLLSESYRNLTRQTPTSVRVFPKKRKIPGSVHLITFLQKYRVSFLNTVFSSSVTTFGFNVSTLLGLSIPVSARIRLGVRRIHELASAVLSMDWGGRHSVSICWSDSCDRVFTLLN